MSDIPAFLPVTHRFECFARARDILDASRTACHIDRADHNRVFEVMTAVGDHIPKQGGGFNFRTPLARPVPFRADGAPRTAVAIIVNLGVNKTTFERYSLETETGETFVAMTQLHETRALFAEIVREAVAIRAGLMAALGDRDRVTFEKPIPTERPDTFLAGVIRIPATCEVPSGECRAFGGRIVETVKTVTADFPMEVFSNGGCTGSSAADMRILSEKCLAGLAA